MLSKGGEDSVDGVEAGATTAVGQINSTTGASTDGATAVLVLPASEHGVAHSGGDHACLSLSCSID